MSAPSPSNPFRQRPSTGPIASIDPAANADLHLNTEEPTQLKVKKKVRVQSPPSSPEDYMNFATTPQSFANDPFESPKNTTDVSNPAKPFRPVSLNPFSKPLKDSERVPPAESSTPLQNKQAAGRASLDVDAFKRLLLTGNAGPIGSEADTASTSRQSIFESIQDPHLESPRTSHEISDDDRPRIGLDRSESNRQKPAPPNSKHGKLIKLELGKESREDDGETPPLSAHSKLSQHSSGPSTPTIRDINKPLPPAPSRASHESDREESVFDKESAGKIPEVEPPSPPRSSRRKTPPAPPISRRHSQLVSDSKLTRSNSGRLSPRLEEGSEENNEAAKTQLGNATGTKAPPPPPSRRPGSIIRSISQNNSSLVESPSISSVDLTNAKKPTSVPPPPPGRTSTNRKSSGRPSSITSIESVNSKRQSTLPPPPPPRRRASSRNSMEAPMSSPSASRTSGEFFRQSMDGARRGSDSSQISHISHADGIEDAGPKTEDILAEIAALQRDLDAARGQGINRDAN